MLFGRDDEIRKMKTAFIAADADMSVVKPWLKTYEKTHKQAIGCTSKYYSEKEKLERLLSELKELETMIIGYERLEGTKKTRFSEILKDFKRLQGNVDDEFLISKEDKDFHSTLASILKIAPAYVKDNQNGLILHSEIENLLAMTKEGLERRHPDMFALAFFYLEHSDRDLEDMNFDQKVETVMAVYEEGFLKPVRGQVTNAIERAKNISEENDRIALKIKPFLDVSDTDDFFRKICRV